MQLLCSKATCYLRRYDDKLSCILKNIDTDINLTNRNKKRERNIFEAEKNNFGLLQVILKTALHKFFICQIIIHPGTYFFLPI
jgi:hypothetical protein